MSGGPADDRPVTAHPGWTLATCICASSLAFIDGSVVNVALPALGRDLHAGAADLQWTINAYLLPLSALLLIGGALGDQYGRRRFLILGTALFVAASLGCALAPDLAALLAARGVQGIGAALLMPNSLAILGNAFSGEAKGRAIGTWAAAGAITAAIGPPLGGWLIDTIDWRAIFYLNVPVGAAAIVIARRYVAESGSGDQPIDWRGATLATLGLGALTWGLTLWSSRHRLDIAAVAGLVGGAAALSGFVLTEYRLGERAMMPLTLFASRAFAGLTLLTFMLYGALAGLLLLLPYLLINQGGYSPLQAGLATLPFAVVIGTASRLMGRLTERIGPRWPLSLGPALVAIGFVVMTTLDPTRSYAWHVLPGLLIVAIGMAGAVAPLTTAVLSSVDDTHVGTASGFNSAIARTGGLIATALAGGVIGEASGRIVPAFHLAVLVAAALAAASAATAWFTLPRKG